MSSRRYSEPTAPHPHLSRRPPSLTRLHSAAKPPPRISRSRSGTVVGGEDLAHYVHQIRKASREATIKQESRSPSMESIKAYASLPPTPRLSDGSREDHKLKGNVEILNEDGRRDPEQERSPVSDVIREAPPFSLWEYLREELLAADFDSHQELKWERVSNFLSIPVGVEKVLSFGFILCLDTWLYTFTILPIRATVASWRALVNTVSRSRPPVPPAHKADILRLLLLVISVAILAPLTDVSKIYHSIRGQDTIKLYVIFNALEIADRLLTSIGQDILDCMFSRSTLLLLTNHAAPTTNTLRPFIFFVLSVIYVVSHGLILIYQLTSLNVAINAYDNALLTLLLSNQFVEIKGSVFKKFEKDNLFQITCADIVERFQLALMLGSIAIRNLIELSSSELDLSADNAFVLPVAFKAFKFISGRHIIGPILTPVATVMMSELFVDWLKHAFITKFNHIRPSVYERYIDVLCRDLTTGSWYGKRRPVRKHTYVDQSPVVARRLGFAAVPLAVLSVIIGAQSVSLLISTHFPDSAWALLRDGIPPAEVDYIETGKWVALVILSWLSALTVKLILGINLLSYASRRRVGMDERMKDDEEINDFSRPAIGEGIEEIAYNRELKDLLAQPRDDVPPTSEIGENPKPQPKPERGATESNGKPGGGGGGKKRVKLEDLTRFTMVKRIW